MRISDWSSDVCSSDLMDLKTFGLPLAAIYLISDLGSIAGGWMSSKLIKAGRTPNFARKFTMFVCACCVVPVWFAQDIDNVWTAVLVIGLATAAHQAFSANLYTLRSDEHTSELQSLMRISYAVFCLKK